MEQRLSFITLGVADLTRACAFYAALGWTASGYGEGAGVIFYQLPGMVFGLFPRADLAAETGIEDTPPGFSGVSLSYNTRSEAEVDEVLRQAKAAGGRILKPGHRASWGGYTSYFSDLDGHVWEACFNPQVILDEAGAIRLPTR